MGAFFLFSDSEATDLEPALGVFHKKGFAAPEVFRLGWGTLWLFRKQLISEPNYVVCDDGSAVYSTGTPVYRGLSYRDTLRELLDDFRKGRLDMSSLVGNYCLIFDLEGRTSVLIDRLCVHHVFMDDARTRFSTSFLALLASFKHPQPLNPLSFYEKVCTGYNVGPETTVSSILQLTPQLEAAITAPNLRFITHPADTEPVSTLADGFHPCVERQLSALRRHLAQMKNLVSQYQANIGLSGGYDSRLLFLLCRDAGFPVSLHSHLTVGTHENELKVAETIAKMRGTRLRVVRTRRVENLEESEVEHTQIKVRAKAKG